MRLIIFIFVFVVILLSLLMGVKYYARSTYATPAVIAVITPGPAQVDAKHQSSTGDSIWKRR